MSWVVAVVLVSLLVAVEMITKPEWGSSTRSPGSLPTWAPTGGAWRQRLDAFRREPVQTLRSVPPRISVPTVAAHRTGGQDARRRGNQEKNRQEGARGGSGAERQGPSSGQQRRLP